jgi:hypothetical protein
MSSVDGKGLLLIQHCSMMHAQVTLPFLIRNIFLPMLVLVHVMPCLFPFAIILQSGEVHLYGKPDCINFLIPVQYHCNIAQPTMKNYSTYAMHQQEMLLNEFLIL